MAKEIIFIVHSVSGIRFCQTTRCGRGTPGRTLYFFPTPLLRCFPSFEELSEPLSGLPIQAAELTLRPARGLKVRSGGYETMGGKQSSHILRLVGTSSKARVTQLSSQASSTWRSQAPR